MTRQTVVSLVRPVTDDNFIIISHVSIEHLSDKDDKHGFFRFLNPTAGSHCMSMLLNMFIRSTQDLHKEFT